MPGFASNPIRTARALLAATADRLPSAQESVRADVLILAVGPAGTDPREAIAEARRLAPLVYVRPRPLDNPSIESDLDFAVDGEADGVVLPGAFGAGAIQHLGAKLAVWEAEHGRADGRTRILALIDDAAAALALLTTRPPGGRLVGLIARPPPDAPGRAARLQAATLFAADAWDVPAFVVEAEDLGPSRLAAARTRARRDGFAGLVTSDPGALAAIRAAFPPG